MIELAAFWVHAVTVETFLGSGGMGDVYAPPAPLACFVDDKRTLVRSAGGEEVISETTLFAPAGVLFLTEDSRVTLPSGRVAYVITIAARDSGDLALPDHVEAHLT